MLFLQYTKCSTCKKAKKYLENKNVNFKEREIKEENPTYDELKAWIDNYNIPISKLWNTSGIKYRELNLKEELKNMNQEEQLKLLSSDGMLVKRPILLAKDKLLIGFKEKEWDDYLNHN